MEEISENILVDIDDKLANKPEYKKLLNNLLGISNRDNSIFTASRIDNIDLKSLLSYQDYKKVFQSNSFNVEIKDINDDMIIKDLISSNDSESFIEIIENSAILLSIADRKLIEADFEKSKEKIINKLKIQKNQKISKWKKLRNKYLDKQIQTNSWPLYVGSMFIKIKTIKATLYAPLILKKAEINITTNNKIYIKSIDDSIEINEKLLFLLQNEYKFNLGIIDEGKEYSLEEVSNLFKESLEPLIDPIFDFKGEFERFTKGEVKNQDLQYAPGIVLTISSPSGGNLRDKLIEMLQNDVIEDLLDIDLTKDLKDEISSEIENGNGIYRIIETDLSQERAIIGSLMDSSIIWGPPGTGKSQTISNIIANILAEDKTAIITSEKKAALDVIQKRMGKLAKFMFFGLTDKNINKESFYKPFRELAEIIKYNDFLDDKEPISLITSPEKKYSIQKEILSNENIDSLILVNKKTSIYDLKNIYQIFNFLKGKDKLIKNLSAKNDNIKSILSKSGIRKSFPFFNYPKIVRKFIKSIIKTKNDYEYFIHLSKINDLENLKNYKSLLINETEYKNDRYTFRNDEDYLEHFLTNKFRERIQKLEEIPEYKNKIKSFLRSSLSAWRMPHKFVKIHQEVITDLFDIFVSTPQTLSGIIDMDYTYDYAIFDEASQLNLEKGIPFIYLANKSIIAGDNQQMRPTNYFSVRDSTEIVNDTEMNVESLLDYAYRRGLQSREYMLTKNYRSKTSELMAFSSREFYKSELDVIDHKEFTGHDSIEVYDVNGKWEARINEEEAKCALDKLLEEKDNFKKIILLTLNSTQKQYIESLIYNDIKYKEIMSLLEDERVFLRNLENIQGDEADLVIVSVAYDSNARLGSTYVARPEGKNALNVAISRAIEKMIVFKSIKPGEISGNVKNDSIRIFRDWISFIEMSSDERKEYLIESDKESERFDSTFEEDVYDSIIEEVKTKRKVFIQTQFIVGTYSIDIAIINSKTNQFILGIEVDGYKYHSGFEKMTKDIERQRFIESKGYSIYRITELNWKIKKEEVIEEIKKLIS